MGRTAPCFDGLGIGPPEGVRPGQGSAYRRRGRGGQVRPGEPLGPVTVRVTRLDSTDAATSLFDFRTWRGRGCGEYEVTVDAAQDGVYSADPYGG